jgi:hypothetical protein
MKIIKYYRIHCPPHGSWISEATIKNVCPSCNWKNKQCRPLPEPEEMKIDIPDGTVGRVELKCDNDGIYRIASKTGKPG